MKKILIVEDEKEYKDLLTQKLETEGFEVVSAENGQAALDMLTTTTPDLIILDLVMPKMDGTMFMYHLGSLKLSVPIIILTNLTTATYPTDIAEFLVKANTSLDDVVTKVKEHLPTVSK